MKFCWDFKTKRLGKIEHTLSRDYSWSNFKSDFYLFEQFSYHSHTVLSLAIKWSRVWWDIWSSGMIKKGSKLILVNYDPIFTPERGRPLWTIIYESVYLTHWGQRFESRIDLPLSVSRRVGYFLVVLESVRLNSRDNTWDFDTWWFMLQGDTKNDTKYDTRILTDNFMDLSKIQKII